MEGRWNFEWYSAGSPGLIASKLFFEYVAQTLSQFSSIFGEHSYFMLSHRGTGSYLSFVIGIDELQAEDHNKMQKFGFS